MTITYEVGDGLYVNVTNRCTNACEFCVRQTADGTYGELWLDREPTANEILSDILSRDLTKYSELVFCGYGEPTLRLDDILFVCESIRGKSGIKIRINTNGHANLIYGCDVTPKLKGLIDCVSVSLNTADAESYVKVCHPDYGEAAYAGLLDFAAKARRYVPSVMLSIVRGSIPDEDIEKCREIADSVGIPLKIREYIK
jgi:TatD family-associated radical SAM protein